MKFLVSFRGRRQDRDGSRHSPARAADAALPSSLIVHQQLWRVGGDGGYAVVETDRAEDLRSLVDAWAGYDCRIEPVVDAARGTVGRSAVGHVAGHQLLPEMPESEPHEGAFSDDDVYDTED